MLGLGHDVVDVSAFAEQLGEPGSRMRKLFSMRELWQTAQRAQLKHDDESVHLAARWAGKEAFLKAWCEAISRRQGDAEYPYTLDNFPWVRIEVLDDSRGVPSVSLSPELERKLHESLGVGQDRNIDVHVSMSHDGAVASAVVMLEA
ncbi:holo-ACP synthase [Bifidobacterium sp. UBA6881]|uniref:holo-ACP synthase n=1 Tax=Bifidobacterium sp. UBA6881 TaxID=1946109 RepID=UPI000EEA66D9|nr:holo-ACP synthase [Bifidobacterium sp. UBA6881]HAH53648.1 ACP synthase [Bifidobacterium sp.]HAK72158.1 ACP synthase [Bifidobacterium sp.]HCA73977.1 ACP synthase [Bifidobacterium sp.]HCH21876.1 ACP synthase [Bifidobacterium sp.]